VGVLAEPIAELGQGIGRIIDALNPASENFFLKAAFIPSPDFMMNYATEIKDELDEKMGFITEIKESLGNIFGAVIEPDPVPPKFEITLPGGKWGQGKIKIIDFSIFAQYRPFILNFMRVLLWIPFLMKMYRRLPQLVYK
jgi:hypothetical protein